MSKPGSIVPFLILNVWKKVSKVVKYTNTAFNNKTSLFPTATLFSSAHPETLEPERLVGKFELNMPTKGLSDEACNDSY